MPTVGDVARAVLAAVDTTAGHLLAAQWVAARYTQLCSRSRLRHLRRVGVVTIPAPVTDGVATFTDGSTTVTGDATAQTAWLADGMAGRHIRYMTIWYEVARMNGAALELTSPANEGTSVAVAYQAVQRYVTLAPDVRWLSQEGMVLQRVWRPLRNTPLSALDYSWPSRPLVGPWPLEWAELDVTAAGARRVEFYPISGQAETVFYVYWSIPPALTLDAEVPPQIDAAVLVEGALIDAMRYNAARAMNDGKMDAAGYWRNEYRAQNLTWETRIMEAIRADRGVDDVTFILQMQNAFYGQPQDLISARDHVWYGWRP